MPGRMQYPATGIRRSNKKTPAMPGFNVMGETGLMTCSFFSFFNDCTSGFFHSAFGRVNNCTGGRVNFSGSRVNSSSYGSSNFSSFAGGGINGSGGITCIVAGSQDTGNCENGKKFFHFSFFNLMN